MRLHRKGLCLVATLLGCWSLKPGDAVPDAGSVDVVEPADVRDAAMDIPADAPTDARDAAIDSNADAPADARDAAIDSNADAPADARDAAIDSNADAPTDVAPDVVFAPSLRLLGPPGLSTVTTRQPLFTWSAPVTNVEFVACGVRDCASRVLVSTLVSGTSFRPAAPLPAGVLFWQLRVPGDPRRATPVWQVRIPAVGRGVEGAFGVSQRDVNGDGFTDVALGAPGPRTSPGGGAAYVFVGSPMVASAPGGIVGSATPGFGWDVALGDFAGDGRAELAVAAFVPGVTPIGRVFVAQSGTGLLNAVTELRCDAACETGEFYGTRLAAGDLDGDGQDDVLVAAPGPVGRVLMHRGGPMGISALPSAEFPNPVGASTAFGSGLAVLGDIDGDGFGDVGVGAICDPPQGDAGANTGCTNARGRMHLYFGAADLLRVRPVVITVDGTVSGRLGRDIAAAGDIDNDGYADFVVGGTNGPTVENSGVVHLFRGGPRGSFTMTRAPDATVTSNGGTSNFGAAVAAMDLNGDRETDLLSGASGPFQPMPGASGFAAVYLRGPGGFEAQPRALLNPPGNAALVGWDIAAVGDVNGDGRGDFVAGAPASLSATSPGAGFVWLGGATTVTRSPDVVLRGPDDNAWLGMSVSR